jgi:hypothetical protein
MPVKTKRHGNRQGKIRTARISRVPSNHDLALPSQKNLADDLGKIRTRSVGQPTAKLALPHLTPVVRGLASDPDLPLSVLIEDALSEAIERFGTGPYAEAIALLFGFHRDDKGTLHATPTRLPVEVRRDKSAEIMDLEPDSFDKLRGRGVLEDLAEQLLVLVSRKHAATNQEDPSSLSLYGTQPNDWNLRELFQSLYINTDRLRCFLLATLCVPYVDSQLPHPSANSPSAVRDTSILSQQGFATYAAFISGASFLYSENLKPHLAAVLKAESLNDIHTLIEEIRLIFPFGKAQNALFESTTITPQTTEHESQMRELYDSTWRGWYLTSIGYAELAEALNTDQSETIETLIMKASRITQLLDRQRIRSTDTIVFDGSRWAIGMLKHYYNLEMDNPSEEESAIVRRARTYFDTKLKELAWRVFKL